MIEKYADYLLSHLGMWDKKAGNDVKWKQFLSQVDLTSAKQRSAIVKLMTVSNYATYGYALLMASTWNKELLYDIGVMFGKEALASGIAGWYSPAINLHRSPFAGRIYEYYSEDPVLTGDLAATVTSGAGDAGTVFQSF